MDEKSKVNLNTEKIVSLKDRKKHFFSSDLRN